MDFPCSCFGASRRGPAWNCAAISLHARQIKVQQIIRAIADGGHELMTELLASYNCYRRHRRQHRRADGRLVPQGDQERCRSVRAEIPHRRLRRQHHPEDRRGAAAARRRRHLSGAGEGHARRRRMGRAVRRREARLLKVAKYYYYPGWWEGCGQAHNIINLAKWNEPAEDLPVRDRTLRPAMPRGLGTHPDAHQRRCQSGAQLQASLVVQRLRNCRRVLAGCHGVDPCYKALRSGAYRASCR